jgi:hypothetical protein
LQSRMPFLPEPASAAAQFGTETKQTALDRDGNEVSVGSFVRDAHGVEYEVKEVFDAYPDTTTPSPHARRLLVVDATGGRRYSLATDFSRIDGKNDHT